MAIFLPKSDTDASKTGGSEWETIEHTSQTQREAIVAFETYLSKLSEKIKNIDKDVSDYKKIASSINEDVEKTKTVSEKTRDLVIFGFFVLLLMVIAIIFSYIEFIYSGSKNDDYKYNLSQQVNNQENEIDMLKLCLKAGGWGKCF